MGEGWNTLLRRKCEKKPHFCDFSRLRFLVLPIRVEEQSAEACRSKTQLTLLKIVHLASSVTCSCKLNLNTCSPSRNHRVHINSKTGISKSLHTYVKFWKVKPLLLQLYKSITFAALLSQIMESNFLRNFKQEKEFSRLRNYLVRNRKIHLRKKVFKVGRFYKSYLQAHSYFLQNFIKNKFINPILKQQFIFDPWLFCKRNTSYKLFLKLT